MLHRMTATLRVYGPAYVGVTIRLPARVFLTTNEELYKEVAGFAYAAQDGAMLFNGSFPGGGVSWPANLAPGFFMCRIDIEVPGGNVQLEAMDWPLVSP